MVTNVVAIVIKKGHLMEIEKMNIKRLNPAPYNPRRDLRPGDLEYQKLLRSLDEFGCVETLVWNRRTGNLVAGHQRLKVLLARGDQEVLCSVVDLPLNKEKALNIALNKISGEWDDDRLAVLLDELIDDADLDFEVTGFDLPEAARLTDDIFIPDDYGAESFDLDSELRNTSKPVTNVGEVIQLGPHRVLCGDSTKSGNIAKLFGEEEPDVIFTDPTFAVEDIGPKCKVTLSDDTSRSLGRMLRVVADTKCNAKYVCGHWRTFVDYVKVLGPPTMVIVWDKSRQSSSRMRGRSSKLRNSQLAFIFYYGHRKRKAGLFEEDVWDFPNEISTGHPTLKPLDLCIRALRNSSSKGEVVFDPFLGFGSTLVAAERLDRRCFGVEIDPRRCDCIVRRYIALASRRGVSPEILDRYHAKDSECVHRT